MATRILYRTGDEINNGIIFVCDVVVPNGKRRRVIALCPCGTEWEVSLGNIRTTKNVGCYKCSHARGSIKRIKHGKAGSREYNSWHGMIGRCSSVLHPKFHRYGGRGITVCRRWRGKNGFTNFFKDMGPQPGLGYSIDRIDNDGPYSPRNCQWATVAVQARNRHTNHWVTHKGKTKTISDWSKDTGIGQATIRLRLARGWSIREALTRKASNVPRRTNQY